MNEGIGRDTLLRLFAPDYKTPRSVQMNVGIQRELRRGLVFTADYLRNVETRTLVGVDVNGEGNVGNFNLAGAQAAIAATNAQFGAATVDQAIAKGATLVDYTGNGMGISADVTGVGCTQSARQWRTWPSVRVLWR